VLGLRPVRGSDRPLRESLPTIAQQIGTNALVTIDVRVDADAESTLDRAEREALFYVAADALGNVARHARARHVQLHVSRERGDVVLEVADDGVGFDTAEKMGGLGLRNMRQRAFDIGARLDVTSKPGSGTRLQVRVPRPAEVKT
jgi:signal transduction histidine kinase